MNKKKPAIKEKQGKIQKLQKHELSKEFQDIKDQTIRRLGSEDLNGLMKWHNQIMEHDAAYVAYVTGRSYALGELMGRITKNPIKDDSNKFFVTDVALLSCCEKLADFYIKNGKFPKILLCEDVLVHGRNLNGVIINLENRMTELLGKDYSKEKIVDDLSDAIAIRVYCFAETGHVLLKYRYMKDARFIVKQESPKWRELSGKLSSVIPETGSSITTFLPSQIISKEDAKDVIKEGFDEFRVQNVKGFTKIRLLKNAKGEVVAAYSIRLLMDQVNENYHVLPFLFLPNLDEQETAFLFQKIKKQGLLKGHPEEFFRKLEELGKIRGKRAFNEWISLILNAAILQEFKGSHTCERNKEQIMNNNLMFKNLARNFRFDETDAHKVYLKNCLEKMPIFLNTKELDDVLLECGKQRPLFHAGKDKVKPKKQFMEMEDYFYDLAVWGEHDAIIYNGSFDMQRGATNQMVRNCFAILRRFLDEKAVGLAKDSLSYLLFLTDVGAAVLSCNPSTETNVVGYGQFLMAGEQALLLKPLRFMRIIPILSVAYDFCKGFSLDYCNYLKEIKNSGFCSFSNDIDDFISFIKEISQLEQTVDEWNGNYVEKTFENGKFEKDHPLKPLYDEYKEYGESRERYLKEYMEFFDYYRNH